MAEMYSIKNRKILKVASSNNKTSLKQEFLGCNCLFCKEKNVYLGFYVPLGLSYLVYFFAFLGCLFF